MLRRVGALTGLLLVAAGTLSFLAPDPRRLADAVQNPQDWVGVHGADLAVLTVTAALGWMAVVWLALGLLLTMAGQLPGMAGQVGRALATAVLPRLIRQGLALSLGVGIAVGSSTAWASTPTAETPRSPSSTAASPAGVTLDWPMRPSGSNGSPPPSPAPQAGVVVVQPGDSLWRIAESRLGPQAGCTEVVTAVHAWYVTNSDVIGADPDLIQPGQQLRPPGVGDSR